MRFLSGGGPFVTMWLFFSILGAVYLVLMNPGHGIWPRLLGVAYGCGWCVGCGCMCRRWWQVPVASPPPHRAN